MPTKTPIDIEIEKYGKFIGADFSDEEFDELIYHNLDFMDTQDLARMERELFTCKWFDYRFMHYARATYLFVDFYTKIFRQKYAVYKDASSAKYMKPIKEQNILLAADKKVMTGFWRARQNADVLCIPYDYFISNSIDYAMRIKRDYLPAPSQLYSSRSLESVTQKWKEYSRVRVIQAVDPRYQTPHHEDSPDQRAHMKWVLDLASHTSNPAHSLKTAMTTKRTITADAIVERFGLEMLQRVLEL